MLSLSRPIFSESHRKLIRNKIPQVIDGTVRVVEGEGPGYIQVQSSVPPHLLCSRFDPGSMSNGMGNFTELNNGTMENNDTMHMDNTYLNLCQVIVSVGFISQPEDKCPYSTELRRQLIFPQSLMDSDYDQSCE